MKTWWRIFDKSRGLRRVRQPKTHKKTGKPLVFLISRKEKAPGFLSKIQGPGCTMPRDTGKRFLRDYMLSIMTWPKPEQLTCVAPSIRRAKS